MTSNNTRKHPKWSAGWEKDTKVIVGKEVEIDKLFKKDETKPDGTKVTKDEGETIKVKVNDFENLLTEITAQKKVVDDKLEELGGKKGYKTRLAEVYKAFDELDKQLNGDGTGGLEPNGWKGNKRAYIDRYKYFLKGDTTHGWGINGGHTGYLDTMKTYLKQKYNKMNTTTLTEAYDNNLYEGNFSVKTATGSELKKFRITENEAVKLITRTVKELGKIDKTKFANYVNSTAGNLPTGSYYPSSVFTKPNVITWMNNICDRAEYLQDNKIKTDGHADNGKPANGKRVEYSFGDDFTDDSGNSLATNNFTHTELEQLFNLAKLFSDYAWVNHNDLKDAIKDVADDTLIILPAQANPIKSAKLKEMGVEGYVDDNGNSNFYATDYGTRISDGSVYRPVEYSWDSAFEVKVEDGLQGWTRLLNYFRSKQYGDDINVNKLISSFTNDPLKQFFADIRSCDEFGRWGTTQDFTYYNFPNYYQEKEMEFYELKGEKKTILEEGRSGRKDLLELDKQFQEERQKLFDKEKEADKMISDRVVELRTELKTKYKVDDTTAPNFGNGTDATDANRIAYLEHHRLQRLISNIRYLVSCDEEKLTDKANENTAFTLSKGIIDKVSKDYTDIIYWHHMGPGDGTKTCDTDEERIALIKTGEGIYKWCNLTYYHDKFVEIEKLIKLDSHQLGTKKKLKEAVDNQKPEETMKDWQNTLKTYEAGLETALTEEKINKWKEKKDEQDAFNNLAAVETLIKKVCVFKKDADNKDVFDKINDDFISFIGGKDSKLKTLSDLIKEKDPTDVILIIHQWEYNKLDETNKKIKHKKFAWSKLGGEKKVDEYELTDDDKKAGGNFEKFLYQCAIGKINENSLTKPTEQEETPNNNNTKMSWAEEWFQFGSVGKSLLAYGLITAVIVGSCCVIWWKNIQEWWSGPKDEEIKGDDSDEKEGEE